MPSYTRATRYTIISQVGFYGFLLVCLILKPNFLLQRNEGGISNYGVYTLTIIPYTLAFLMAGVFLYLAGKSLPEHVRHRVLLAIALTTLNFLFFLVLLSTYMYQVNATFDSLHIAVSAALFFAELVTGIGLGLYLCRDLLNIALLGVQLLGFVLSALTFEGILHLLSLAQTIMSIFFGLLLIRSISILTDPLHRNVKAGSQ